MLQVIVATDNGESWNYQTGDPSFMGNAYGLKHWATVHVGDSSEPDDLIEQWEESIAQDA